MITLVSGYIVCGEKMPGKIAVCDRIPGHPGEHSWILDLPRKPRGTGAMDRVEWDIINSNNIDELLPKSVGGD